MVGGLVVVTSAEPVVGAVVVVDGVLVVVDAAVPGVGGCAVLGAGDGAGALAAEEEEPGCSLATVTQTNAVAPPAATIAVLVKRLMRSCASRPRHRRMRRPSVGHGRSPDGSSGARATVRHMVHGARQRTVRT